MGTKERLRAIGAAVAAIEKQFGKGAIMPIETWKVEDVPTISTGSLGLDIALGVGGWPRGRVVEIFGPESSGKTTLALHAIAETQRAGGVCAFVDGDLAFDVSYAKRVGVDLGCLLVSQPDCGEQALEITDQLVRTGAVDIIVVDSVAALALRAETEGEDLPDDQRVYLRARLFSQALRRITAVASKQNATVIFVNGLPKKTGLVFGSPETAGSNALKFYASVRVDVRRVGQVEEGVDVAGGRFRAKVIKNKVAPPFREAEFDIRHGEGVDQIGEVFDLGVSRGLIEKSGDHLVFDGERIGVGRVEARRYLLEHPEVLAWVRAALVERKVS